MTNDEKVVVNGIEIDEKKAEKIVKKIIIAEKKNLSTKELTRPEIIKKIKDMIEEEVECY